MNLPLGDNDDIDLAQILLVGDELRSRPTSWAVDKLWKNGPAAANPPDIPQRTHHRPIFVHSLEVDKAANSAANLLLCQPALLHSIQRLSRA